MKKSKEKLLEKLDTIKQCTLLTQEVDPIDFVEVIEIVAEIIKSE